MFARQIEGGAQPAEQRSTEDATAGTARGMYRGSGLATVASGILLVAGHILDLGGHPQYGTVLGQSLVLVAHLALVFGLVGLYAAQAPRVRLLGSVGMVVSVLSTALVSGVVLVEIAGAAGASVEAVLAGGVAGLLVTGAGLGFFLGLIMFCIATFRAGIFPRWASLVLLAGDLVFAASTAAGPAAPMVTIGGAALTCIGFVWLGLALIARTGNTIESK